VTAQTLSKSWYRLSLLYVLLICLSANSHALSPDKSISQYVHSDWNNADGLPQNSVTSIAQTEDGYLWMGTLEGLVRFDGARFTLFNTRNTPAFTHNIVVALLVDSKDHLWIATSGGGLLVLKNDHFQQLGSVQGLPSDHVSVIFEGSRGQVWVGTDGGGIAKVEASEIVVQESYAQLGSSIRAITESKSGLWVGTEAGLTLIRADGSQTHFDTEQGLSHDSVRALLSDHTGALWVSTDGGLDKLELGQFKTMEFSSWSEQDIVLAMHEDRHQNLWLASDGGGLKRLQDGKISSYTAGDGLSDDTVLALFESADSSLWIGTSLGGLNRLKDGRVTTFTTTQGLSHNFIRAVYEDDQGALWIGSKGGGLMRYYRGLFQTFSRDDGLPDDTVFSILQDHAGDLWIGTGAGLARRTTDGFEIFTQSQGLSDDTILVLFEDSENTLWVGTYNGGLNKFKDGTFTAFTVADGLGNDTINTIAEDRVGALWLGTRGGGLSRLTNGAITTFTTSDGLADDLVFALHEDSVGGLWIGTYGGGLSRYKDGRFSVINETHGLFDNVIHRIIDDGQGLYWMSSNRGLFAVSQQELNAVADGESDQLSSIVFGTSDGMKNVECNGGANAGTLTADGAIWFPSVAGLLRVSPAGQYDRAQATKVVIEEILVDDQVQLEQEQLALPASTKNLEIHYTATDIFAPAKLRFRYQLQGYDDNWIDAGQRRTAYYSQLPAGDYQFRVIADYGHGSWEVQGGSLSLTVATHYYETAWFRSLLVMTAIILILAVVKIGISQLTRRNLKLEEVVSLRTAELEAVNEKLSQLASEDGLTGLLNRRAFDIELERECRRAERAGMPLALLLLDIDFFKQFDDIYGHPAGDACLQQIATALRKICNRAGESVARYGGEEIAIILPGTSQPGAVVHAETIREHIQQLAIPHAGSAAYSTVTASIGVACIKPTADGQGPALLAAADKALYQAKETGRNRVEAAVD
jgi:diguanylate cyclase (GGDEF)-like protein